MRPTTVLPHQEGEESHQLLKEGYRRKRGQQKRKAVTIGLGAIGWSMEEGREMMVVCQTAPTQRVAGVEEREWNPLAQQHHPLQLSSLLSCLDQTTGTLLHIEREERATVCLQCWHWDTQIHTHWKSLPQPEEAAVSCQCRD